MKNFIRLIAGALLSLPLIASADYIGDFAPGVTAICGQYTTYRPSTGAAFTLAGTPALSVYKIGDGVNSLTQSTTGVTHAEDVDGLAGLNRVCIDTSADGTFYAAGGEFSVVITTGTVDSVSVVGSEVKNFSLNKTYALKPVTNGRLAVVDANGLVDANTVKLGPTGAGTAQTARDIGTSVLLSSGTGTGQISLSTGTVTAGTVGTGAISEASYATTAGSFVPLQITDQGTAQSVADSTHIQLRAAAAFATDELVGQAVLVTGGTTGVGQVRIITAYNGATDTATVNTWTTTPTGTVTYKVFGIPVSAGGSVSVAAGGITSASFAADSITASAIAADAIGASEIANGAIDAATFAAGAITATVIAADAIGASQIATDAIGASEIAASAIGSSELAAAAITNATFAAGAIDASAIAANAIGASELADGAIDAATFAAGAIDASAIAADAIGASEIANGAIDAATFAAGAIDATAIAANAIGSSEIAANALTDAKFDTTAGAFYSQGVVDQGTAQSASGTTIVLRSAAAFADDELVGATILITGGTGVGQSRAISDYVGSTDTATVPAWTTTPSGTITYKVFGTAPGAAGSVSIAAGGITAASFASGAIDAAAIAADAIGASEIANGAIDAATFAANAITSTVIATDAIGAAQIAANAIGAAEIADGAIDSATFATTAGSVPNLNIVDQGTAQSATGTTLRLRAAAAFADDELVGATVWITGGSAGVGQSRTITDYVSSTDTATVADWTTTPSGTITYQVMAAPPGAGGSVTIGAGGISASSFAAGAIDATALADNAITANKIAANAIGASEIANDAITAAKFDSTAGSFPPLRIVDQGTAQAATATSLQLRSAASFADDELIGATCVITGGSTGVGQSRAITDYVGSTDTATVDAWQTTPSGTITYKCFGTIPNSAGASLDAAGVRAAIGMASANLDTQLTNIESGVDVDTIEGTDATDVIDARILAANILRPTVPGRTLDVSATGEAGIDWANIGSPTTTVALTGTTVGTTTAITNGVTLADGAQGGSSTVLTLKHLGIADTVNGESALDISATGTGNAHAIKLLSTNGQGLAVGSTNNVGASISSSTADAVQLAGGTNSDGLQVAGNGSGVDIRANITGNLTGTVNGLTATAKGDVQAALDIISGTCTSGTIGTCVDAARTEANATQLNDRVIAFDDGFTAMISFNAATDTITLVDSTGVAKVAPSTRSGKVYTIFAATK